jgi:ATP-dependent DNA ligase
LGCLAKERPAPYRPGPRAPAWLNVKPTRTLDVIVTSGSTTRIAGGAQRRATP